MQRKIVEILKKYLGEGYDDHQTEVAYASPFTVLVEGGISELPLDDWNIACPPPEDKLLRPLARELITTIRGINQADLYIIPSKERMVRILRDIGPDTFDSKEEEIEWAEFHADYVIKKLRRITPQDF